MKAKEKNLMTIGLAFAAGVAGKIIYDKYKNNQVADKVNIGRLVGRGAAIKGPYRWQRPRGMNPDVPGYHDPEVIGVWR